MSLILNVASFNVRGIQNNFKKSELDLHSKRYEVYIIGIQETKIAEASEEMFKSGNKLMIFAQKQTKHRGIGFLICKRLLPHLTMSKKISDDVAYVELDIPSKDKDKTIYRIINWYIPTLLKAEENPELTTKFYRDLKKAPDVPA